MGERAESKGDRADMTATFSPDQLVVLQKAQRALYQDERKRADMEIARALQPFVCKNFCEVWVTSEKKEGARECFVEYLDEKQKRWHRKGGEEYLPTLVEKYLKALFTNFRMDFVSIDEHGLICHLAHRHRSLLWHARPRD